MTSLEPPAVELTTPARRLPDAAKVIILFAVYYLTATLGLKLDSVSGFATLVWPPSGIALAALLVLGIRVWPAIALGAFAVNLSAGAPFLVACGIGVGNTLEAVVGAQILVRVFQFERSLGRARDVLAFVLVGCLGSTIVSATIGTACLWAGGVIAGDAFPRVWRVWWVGDVLGDLIVAPVILVWAQRQSLRLSSGPGRAIEVAALGTAVALVSLFVFDAIVPHGARMEFRWPFLVFPVLIWAAWRFQQRGATASVLLVSVVAMTLTALGMGPFAGSRLTESLLALYVFVSVAAITTLFLAAVITERNTAAAVRDDALERVEGAARRARFLAEASRILASGLDYDKTISNLARLVVPMLGDNCVVDVIAQDGSIRRVTEASTDPAKEVLLRRLRQYPPGPSRPNSPVLKVLETGTTLFIPRFDRAALQALTPNDEYTDIVRRIAPTSSVTVPLKSRDRVVGAITFGMAESGRSYQPEDIALAEELAARAAVAVDNATLYDQSRHAIRARDVFLAVASHELRTPLTALHLQVGNLLVVLERERRKAADEGTAGPVNRVKEIELQIERLSVLVETLLDISRVGSGRIDLLLEELDLRDLVGSIVTRFRDQATAAGCDLQMVLNDDPGRGRWDRLRVEQVLTNLLANAIKFGAGEPVQVLLVCMPARATITVRDQGIGIARQDHEKIFELFHRTPTERPFGGMGLGLWIARQVVDAMGGSIEVKSALTQGAEFIVSLPRV